MALNGNSDETNGYNSVIKNGDVANANFVKSVIVPIGSIIPWAKSFTGTPSLPDGWVECDGSVLSDSDSPYDGETLPDLNSTQRFLRGSSTSGTTGGSDTKDVSHTHTVNRGSKTVVDNVGVGTAGQTGNVTSGSGGSATQDILPAYYEVVYIMRVK